MAWFIQEDASREGAGAGLTSDRNKTGIHYDGCFSGFPLAPLWG